jgi:hypothetical protein
MTTVVMTIASFRFIPVTAWMTIPAADICEEMRHTEDIMFSAAVKSALDFP